MSLNNFGGSSMKQLVKSLAYILSLSLIVFLLPINQVNATPTYNYEWVSQSGTISADGLAHEYTNLEAGQTINLSLNLRNRTGNTIRNRHRLGNPEAGKQVPIGSYGIGSQTPKQDGTPSFLDLSSFILNNNRFVYYDGPDVPDNGLITMNWTIKLASNLSDGVYNLYVRPVSEYLAWTRQIKNGKLLPTTSSDIFWRLTVGEGATDEYITYTNSEYGFSFEYKSNLVISYSTGDHIVLAAGLGDHWVYSIIVEENLNNLSLDEALDSKVTSEDKTISDILLDGKSAKRYSINNYGDYGNAGVILLNGNYIIRISGDDYSNNSRINFSEFLSTFKFYDV